MPVQASYYNLTLGLWISREDFPEVLARGWAPFPLQHKGEVVVAAAGFVQLNPEAVTFLDGIFTADYQLYKSGRKPRRKGG